MKLLSKKWLLNGFRAVCLIIAIERFCYFKTSGFALSKMSYEASPPSPTSKESPIKLERPLRLLGAGKQFYVFETPDHEYVVKFVKWSRRKPLPLLLSRWSHWMKQNSLIRENRGSFLSKSCQLASEKLKAETAVVSPAGPSYFTLIDNLGISHTINPHHTHFYVQRKASLFTDYFTTHETEAQPLLKSFISTVISQCQKLIRNLDPVLDRNYGVVDSKVILLDIGSFHTSPDLQNPALLHREIVLELLPLREWLQAKHPRHLATFDSLLTEEIKKLQT